MTHDRDRRRQESLEDWDWARQQIRARDRQSPKLLTLSDVRNLPKPVDMVAGLIPAPVPGTSCIGTMFGASGAYKSFLAVHLGMCVDSGQPFLGQPVVLTGSSVLVLGEGQAGAGILADAALDANPAFNRDGNRMHYILGSFPLADPEAVGELTGLCRGLPELRFIWFDSLADFYGDEDESSASGMQKVLAQMRRISAKLGCTVIASGHTGHGARTEDGDELPMDRQRGTSRFRQAWDFELMATGTALVSKKEREAARLPPLSYRMVPRLGSLAVATGRDAASVPDEPKWPEPFVTAAQLSKVVETVWATPGLSSNAIARAARVRRESVQIAIAKAAEVGLIVNTGRESAPKWSPDRAWARWLDENCAEAG